VESQYERTVEDTVSFTMAATTVIPFGFAEQAIQTLTSSGSVPRRSLMKQKGETND
jgi:hypothetical protein